MLCSTRQARITEAAMGAVKNFPIFDCDSHVVEPPQVWDEYVPARERAWVKSQFCFHTDSDLLMINGRVVPAAREQARNRQVHPRDGRMAGALWPGARLPRSECPAIRHGRTRHRPGHAVPDLVCPPS